MRWDVRHARSGTRWSRGGGSDAGWAREVELKRFRKTATNPGDSRCVKDGWSLCISSVTGGELTVGCESHLGAVLAWAKA
jgi:hypothetical protein